MYRPTSLLKVIKEQYEDYPYPPLHFIEEEDPLRNLINSFNYELGLPEDMALDNSSKIWVAGCGTRWAVMLALQYKNIEIVATDLSEKSITVQKNLARNLGINNITFKQGNILETSYNNSFNYISCVGVLHHLPDPSTGFRLLAKSLKPTGIAEIMVYDFENRRYSIKMSKILSILDPKKTLSATKRYHLALSILTSLNRKAALPKEYPKLLHYLKKYPDFKNELADFISNPNENYYDVFSLSKALEEAGLVVFQWKTPELFDPKKIIGNPKVYKVLDGLNKVEKAYIANTITESFLELFVSLRSIKKNNKPLVKINTETMVRAIPFSTKYQLNNRGDIIGSTQFAKIQEKDGILYFDAGERRAGVLYYGKPRDCIDETKRMLQSVSDCPLKNDIDKKILQRSISILSNPKKVLDLMNILQQEFPYENIEMEKLISILAFFSKSPNRIFVIN